MIICEACNRQKDIFVGIQSVSHVVVNYAKSQHRYYNKTKFRKNLVKWEIVSEKDQSLPG